MAHYQLVTEWHAGAPSDRVWDTLLRVREWPTWWKGFRAVDVLEPGDDRGVGMRLRQRWRSLLPYTLTLDLEIIAVEQKRRLEGRVSGDLVGWATWTMDEEEGGTRIRFILDVTPGRRWMNLPFPFADRVVGANHRAIMRRGSDGLARILGSGVIDATPRLRLAGA